MVRKAGGSERWNTVNKGLNIVAGIWQPGVLWCQSSNPGNRGGGHLDDGEEEGYKVGAHHDDENGLVEYCQ